MNVNNVFPSKYLKSGDIEGADMVLTISHVEVENVGQGENAEVKPVVYFTETDKGFILNKTNAGTISRLYTPETDNWPGKQIAIFATEVDFAGNQTLALRVRMKAPAITNGTQPTAAKPTYSPVPIFPSNGALAAIAVNLGLSIEGTDPAAKVDANGQIVLSYKAAKEQAIARKLPLDGHAIKPSNTNLEAFVATVALLQACAAKDEPEF